jgi:hypothetical protein
MSSRTRDALIRSAPIRQVYQINRIHIQYYIQVSDVMIIIYVQS